MHPYCILFSISLSLLSSAIKGVVHCNYIGCNRYSYTLCLVYTTQIDCLCLFSHHSFGVWLLMATQHQLEGQLDIFTGISSISAVSISVIFDLTRFKILSYLCPL